MNKTIEEKAKAYADKVDDEYCHDPFSEVHLERMVDECRKAFAVGYREATRDAKIRKSRERDGNQYAYRKGAAEALAGQWRNVENELPKPEQDVFVAIETQTNHQYTLAWLSVLSNDTTRWYCYDNTFHLSRIRYWMPIPELPNPDHHADKT